MTEVITPLKPTLSESQQNHPLLVPLAKTINNLRTEGHVTLGTFSPVNENGSFMFDRVIKEGEVMKRARKTKLWKSVYLVLRPNLLSIYKDRTENKLRHQINLSDLTAVARQKDPGRRAQHVFGLFSESRNYHFSTTTEKEAQDWVELIRQESRLDEDEDEPASTNASNTQDTPLSPGRKANQMKVAGRTSHEQHTGYSSSEAEIPSIRPPSSVLKRRSEQSQNLQATRQVSQSLEYSGPEHASYSDFSDTGMAGMRSSVLSLPPHEPSAASNPPSKSKSGDSAPSRPSMGQRNVSQMSGIGNGGQDEERIVYQGWLLLLKSRRGMRQWKKVWGVLRPKSLALYKDEEEYSALLIIPFSNIIDAVDIDPISRSKPFCMQIISEEHTYRVCAPDEDALTRWLGGLKSLLARRKESQKQRAASPP